MIVEWKQTSPTSQQTLFTQLALQYFSPVLSVFLRLQVATGGTPNDASHQLLEVPTSLVYQTSLELIASFDFRYPITICLGTLWHSKQQVRARPFRASILEVIMSEESTELWGGNVRHEQHANAEPAMHGSQASSEEAHDLEVRAEDAELDSDNELELSFDAAFQRLLPTWDDQAGENADPDGARGANDKSSSSSSCESSSSSSSDSPSAEDAANDASAPVVAALPPEEPRQPERGACHVRQGQPHLDVMHNDVPVGAHIKHNAAHNDFYVRCPVREHNLAGKCELTRTCNPSTRKLAQGRCLGSQQPKPIQPYHSPAAPFSKTSTSFSSRTHADASLASPNQFVRALLPEVSWLLGLLRAHTSLTSNHTSAHAAPTRLQD